MSLIIELDKNYVIEQQRLLKELIEEYRELHKIIDSFMAECGEVIFKEVRRNWQKPSPWFYPFLSYCFKNTKFEDTIDTLSLNINNLRANLLPEDVVNNAISFKMTDYTISQGVSEDSTLLLYTPNILQNYINDLKSCKESALKAIPDLKALYLDGDMYKIIDYIFDGCSESDKEVIKARYKERTEAKIKDPSAKTSKVLEEVSPEAPEKPHINKCWWQKLKGRIFGEG